MVTSKAEILISITLPSSDSLKHPVVMGETLNNLGQFINGKAAADKCLFLTSPPVRLYSEYKCVCLTMCVCVRRCCTMQMPSLTAHKLLLADGEHTPALQHLWVGAAGVDAGQEGLFCHPDGKPLQLAVAQQAGGVQKPARGGGGGEGRDSWA